MNIIDKIKIYVKKLVSPLDSLDYHKYGHTVEVYTRALYLAEKEGLSPEETEILAIACLFHDTGYIVSYDNNEIFGSKIARNFLISHNYPEDKIRSIHNLIMATAHDYMSPTNISEQIIKDADMDNLGRTDFHEKMSHIKTERELAEGKHITEYDWNIRCIEILESYSYFTHTQKQERDTIKTDNLLTLKNKM